MLPIVCITQEGQDHLSLTPFLFKSSKKSLSESVMLCNTANILASHVAVCHNLILVSCGLQSSAQEESEISITEVSKRHDFRCKFKHSHEHPSLNVYWQWKDTGNEKVSSKTSMIVSIQKTKSQTVEKIYSHSHLSSELHLQKIMVIPLYFLQSTDFLLYIT